MKLTKDQIQKIALGVMMLCGVIYAYFTFLLGPLTAARESALKETAALGPKISAAKAQIEKTKGLEANEPATKRLLEQVDAMIPEGAPIAWVPTKIADHFKREGIEKISVRKVSEVPDKEVTGYARISWAVEIPQTEFPIMASAMAALENAEPLMDIPLLEIESGRENVQFQRTTLTLFNTVRL